MWRGVKIKMGEGRERRESRGRGGRGESNFVLCARGWICWPSGELEFEWRKQFKLEEEEEEKAQYISFSQIILRPLYSHEENGYHHFRRKME